jgi:hypothetical protein
MVEVLRTTELHARRDGYQREIREGATADSVIARHGLAADPGMVEVLRRTERGVRRDRNL